MYNNCITGLLVSTYGFTTGLNPLDPEFTKQLQSALSGTLDIQIGPGQIKSISSDGNTHSGPIQRRSLKSNVEIDSNPPNLYKAEIVRQPVHYIYPGQLHSNLAIEEPLTSQGSNNNVQSGIVQGSRRQNSNAQSGIRQSGGNNNNVQSGIKQVRVPTYRTTGIISNVEIDDNDLQTELENIEGSDNPLYSNIAFQDYLESQGFIAEEERPPRANTPIIHTVTNNIQPIIAQRRKNVVYGITQWGKGPNGNSESRRRANNNAQAGISQTGGNNNNVQSGTQQEDFTGLGHYDIVDAIEIAGRPSATFTNAAVAEYIDSQVLLADEERAAARASSNGQGTIVQHGGNNNNIQAGVTQNGRRAKPVINIQTGKPLLSARRTNANVQSAVNQVGGNNNNVQSGVAQNDVPVFYAHKASLVPEIEILPSKPFLIKARQNVPQNNPTQSRRRAQNAVAQSGVKQVGYNNRNIQGNLQQLGRRQNNNAQAAINQVGGNNNNVQSGVSQTGGISQTSGISAPATYDEILISNNGPVLTELEIVPANELTSNVAISRGHKIANSQVEVVPVQSGRNTNVQAAINQNSRRQNTIPLKINTVSHVGQAGRRQNNNAQVPVNQKGLNNKNVQSGITQNGGSGPSAGTVNVRPAVFPVIANAEINAPTGGLQAQVEAAKNGNGAGGFTPVAASLYTSAAARKQSVNNNAQSGIKQVGSNNNNVQSAVKQNSRRQNNNAQTGIKQVAGNNNNVQSGINQARRSSTKNVKVNQVGPNNVNMDIGVTQVRRANANAQAGVNQVGGNNNNVQSGVSQNSGISAPAYYDEIILGEPSGSLVADLDSGNNVVANVAIAPRSNKNYNVQSGVKQVGAFNSNFQGGVKQGSRRANNNAPPVISQIGAHNSNVQSGVKQSSRRQNANAQTAINQVGVNNNNVQSGISQNDPTAPAHSGGSPLQAIDTTGSNMVADVDISSGKINSGNYVNVALADYLDSQVLIADEERSAARTNTNLQSAVKQSGKINNNLQSGVKQNARRANANAQTAVKQEGGTNNNVQSGVSQGRGSSMPYRPPVRAVIPLAGRRQNNNVQSGVKQSGGVGRVVGVAEVDTTGPNADSGNQIISYLDVNDSNRNELISHVDIASQNGLYSNVAVGVGQHHYVGDGHVHIDGDFPNEGMYLTESDDEPVNTAMTQMSSEILSNVLIGDTGRRAIITDGLSSDVIINGGSTGELPIHGLDCNDDLYSSTDFIVVDGSLEDPRFSSEVTILADADNDMLANGPKHRHNNHQRRSGHHAPKCYCEGF